MYYCHIPALKGFKMIYKVLWEILYSTLQPQKKFYAVLVADAKRK